MALTDKPFGAAHHSDLRHKAEEIRSKIGRVGLWYASSGAGHGECFVGAEYAEIIGALIAMGTDAPSSADLANYSANNNRESIEDLWFMVDWLSSRCGYLENIAGTRREPRPELPSEKRNRERVEGYQQLQASQK